MKLQFRIDTYVFNRTLIGINESESLYVEEEINETSLFTDEITRIAKKHCKADFHNWHLQNEIDLFYRDYFSEDFLSHLSHTLFYNHSSLAVPAGKLIKIFSLEDKEIWIVINGQGIGYTVGAYEGIVFTLHTKESNKHHNKHIHCSYGGEIIEIDLVTLQILNGRFKNRKKTKKALQIVTLNQDNLIRFWDSTIGQNIIIPFEMKY